MKIRTTTNKPRLIEDIKTLVTALEARYPESFCITIDVWKHRGSDKPYVKFEAYGSDMGYFVRTDGWLELAQGVIREIER